MYRIVIAPGLEADSIHAMEVGKKAGYGLVLIPAPGNQTCALVAYTAPVNAVAANSASEDTLQVPAILRESATNDEIRESIATNYPLFGVPTDAAIAQLKSQRLSEARTVRCNRYHLTSGSSHALLMGDAAHSTGGTLGKLIHGQFFVTLYYYWTLSTSGSLRLSSNNIQHSEHSGHPRSRSE